MKIMRKIKKKIIENNKIIKEKYGNLGDEFA